MSLAGWFYDHHARGGNMCRETVQVHVQSNGGFGHRVVFNLKRGKTKTKPITYQLDYSANLILWENQNQNQSN